MNQPVSLEFDARVQSLDALHVAAYRMSGIATCEVVARDGHYVCNLSLRPSTGGSPPVDSQTLAANFRTIVIDENVRESMAKRTEPVRNLILSLAFGSLASQANDKT